MAQLSDDLYRFLELLRYKIGSNHLARVFIAENDNPRLKTLHYRTAAPRAKRIGEDSFSDLVPVHGEMVTDAEMIQRIFALALENEGRHIPFSGNQLVFLEALDHKHESYQTFVVLFFSPDML